MRAEELEEDVVALARAGAGRAAASQRSRDDGGGRPRELPAQAHEERL